MGKFAKLGLACLLGAGVAGTSPAAAQELINGSEPERIETIMKAFGIARLETDSEGDPKISGRADGKVYTVYFYGCTDNQNCKSLQFWTYWDQEVPLDRVNDWNREVRFGKVYIDDEDDLVLEMDVNLVHGIHERTLEEDADIWMRLIGRVEKEILAP